MGFGNCVLVNDTPSNLEVIADAGFSYRGSEGDENLGLQLQMLVDEPALVEKYRRRAWQRAQEHYRWEDVVRQHELLYQRILRGGRQMEISDLIRSTELLRLPAPSWVSVPSSFRMFTVHMFTVQEKIAKPLGLSPGWRSPLQLTCKRCLDVLVSALLVNRIVATVFVACDTRQAWLARSGPLQVARGREGRATVRRL